MAGLIPRLGTEQGRKTMAAAAAATTSTKGGFLECMELSESYTEYPVSRPAGGWHSPRISFSNEFAQPSEEAGARNSTALDGSNAASQGSSHNPSSSGEFEFNMAAATTQPPVKCPMLSADELFYKGKLLPLHLPPRIRMVQDLSEVEEKQISRSPALAMMRRERSLRSPARPSVVPCTLKSSSYPPPGCSSRPPSPPKAAKCSSRWRDLFGFKKGQIAAPKPPASTAASASSSGKQAAPSRLLKMIFNRGSNSNSSSSSSSCSEQHPAPAALGHHEASNNEALLPLLRDSSSDSSCPAAEMGHSSSISSTSSFSSSASSNWAASSASSSTASSSSFSADFPEVCSTSSGRAEGGGGGGVGGGGAAVSGRKTEKLGTSRGGRGIGSPGRRRGAAGRVALLNKAAAGAGAGAGGAAGGQSGVDARVVVMKNLQRCGSNRKAASSTSLGKMQLQDHVSIGNNNNNKPLSMRPHSDSWRRPEKAGNGGASYSSSVRVTPVLHVPACIGPSLRSVRVHGFRRLFSSSSSSSGSSKATAAEGVVVM